MFGGVQDLLLLKKNNQQVLALHQYTVLCVLQLLLYREGPC